MEPERSTTPLTAARLDASSFIEFSSGTDSELNFDDKPPIATDGDCSASESTSSSLSSSKSEICVEEDDTADSTDSEDRNLRGLLLRARAALQRLRDCDNSSSGAVGDLRAALELVDTWLSEAEYSHDRTSFQLSSDEKSKTEESSLIRTWTPTATSPSTISVRSQEQLLGDTGSSVSSLRSSSSLIPNELLHRLSSYLLRAVGDGPSGERLEAANAQPTQPQRPASARCHQHSSLHRCLLATPTSAAISDRLLRGRGLLKTSSATSIPAGNFFTIGRQQQKKKLQWQPQHQQTFVNSCQQQREQQQRQQRPRWPSALQKPKGPVIQRTLFSSFKSPTAEQNSLTMLCSRLPMTASSTASRSKPRHPSKKRRPTTRVMAIVTRDSAGRAVSSDAWSQAGILDGFGNASDCIEQMRPLL